MNIRVLITGVCLTAAVAAQAITFTVRQISGPPVANGASWVASANSITFSTPNAIVGDPTDPLRSANLYIEYDVDAGANQTVNEVLANLGAVTLGSGVVSFTEQVFKLDTAGNEVGGAIGTISHNFNSSSNPNFSGSTGIFAGTRYVRVKKAFTLAAPATNDLDLAGIAINNQSVVTTVPEPTSLAALAVAGMLILRRKK